MYIGTFTCIGRFTIKIESPITTEEAEELEDRFRDLLRQHRIDATIEDNITGNTTKTDDRDEELE